MKQLSIIFASAFGAGFAPFAPGTFGSLVGTAIIYVLWINGVDDTGWPLLMLTIGLSIIGLLSINRLPENWIHDDQRIVIDEVVGLFTTILFIPLTWKSLILSLILFRIFDIWKPLGIRKFDDLQANYSVIVDDLVAGIYANITLRVVIVILTFYDLW